MAGAADKRTRRQWLQVGLGGAVTVGSMLRNRGLFGAPAEGPFRISDRFSPRNQRRPARPYTLYIVLHTTEGAETGSLDKVWRRGETHYFLGLDGHVLRIIDRAKIATHAGRSMWEGHRNIDDYAIGIEVVGYHNREINENQYSALRTLLRQLRDIYGISDKRVVTHSMVAYGCPNRFFANDHRGRKRCGMIFARPDVRLKLGLTSKPEGDDDVRAGRLIVADAELYRFLYTPAPKTAGAMAAAQAPVPVAQVPEESNIVTRNWTPWMIARDRYDHPDTTYVMPDGKKLPGDQIKDWNRIPEGTRVQTAEGEVEIEQVLAGFREIGKDGHNARDLAGEAYNRDTTIYFFPDGLVRTGRELSNKTLQGFLEHPPEGTRVLVGYVYGGFVKSSRPASTIAGIKWNYPSTYYRFPDGKIVSGDEIDDAAIPVHTLIFYQH